MNKLTRNTISVFLWSVAIAMLPMLPSAFGEEQAKKPDGKALFEQKCLKCHKNTNFKKLASDRKGWELTLSRMQRGTCPMTDDELEILADYLAKVYGE